jgi:hypothetical protein
MNPHKFVFVGQGPNQTAWLRGKAGGARSLALGIRKALREGGEAPTPDEVEASIDRWAMRYCAIIALTGAVGTRIGRLLDLEVGAFMWKYERRNLNARWNGKAGKGDRFDRDEAGIRSDEILAEGFDRVVCVGAAVGAAFGLGKIEPLGERGVYIPVAGGGERYVSFFLLPHPSGIVQWWNDDFNRFRARKRLREFLELPTNAQK